MCVCIDKILFRFSLDVVKAIEALGSGSGRTSKKVVIEDCGQL